MNDQKETTITPPNKIPNSEWHVELTWVEKLMMRFFPKKVKEEVVSTFDDLRVCTKCFHKVHRNCYDQHQVCHYCGAISPDGIFETFTEAIVRKVTTYTYYKTLLGTVIMEQSYLTFVNFIYPNRVRNVGNTSKCDTIKDLHDDVAPLIFSSYKELVKFPVGNISTEHGYNDVIRYVYHTHTNVLVPYFRNDINQWIDYSLWLSDVY